MTPQHVGPYEILEKLGSGGMATVFLGRHRETGLEAAVKVLPPSLARQEGFVERFAREVESMQRLSNPHIVKFYEAGEDHDTYFYAMEYVKGETLTNLIRREKKLSWQQSVDIAVQVCRALKSAHDAGVIHRDLKPSNL
ncbi:MAG TPA: serine/threonine-protein kinase, partial [Nitrolancea sp.]|nr:serine/threonine-protein kinase [Nitrolancea sp.]